MNGIRYVFILKASIFSMIFMLTIAAQCYGQIYEATRVEDQRSIQYDTLDVKTEFELKHEIVFDKKNNKKKKIKIPDLLVGNTAIEVELTQKNLTRIYDIIREYEYGGYDKVTYYTTHTIANIMSNITKTNDKFQYNIINENDIINSIEFVNPKYPIKEKILNEKQKLREILGL